MNDTNRSAQQQSPRNENDPERDEEELTKQDERTQRLMAVLPDEAGLWQTLYYFPSWSPTWEEETEKARAVQETEEWFTSAFTQAYVQREMDQLRRLAPPVANNSGNNANTNSNVNHQRNHGRKKKTKRQRRSHHDDENDIDEEYESYAYDEEHQQSDPYNHVQSVAQQSLLNETATRAKLANEATQQLPPYLQFLRALPECEPLTAGFLVLPIASHQECCFCPCSNKLESWRKQTVWKNQQQPASFPSCGNTGNRGNSGEGGNSGNGGTVFHADGLVAHITELRKSSALSLTPDWWHWIVLEYLKRVFENYRGPNCCHKAFLPPDGRPRKAAERLEHARVGGYIQNLCETQQAQKRNMAQLLQKTSQLETHCQHLAKSLDQRRRSELALRSLLATSWDGTYPNSNSHVIPQNEMNKYQAGRDKYFSMVRKCLRTKKLLAASITGLQITIPQRSFQLQAILRDNRELFLDDLSRRDAAKWLLPMNVKYETETDRGEKPLEESLKQDVSAVDRGGPTRQFLSEAFQSLDRIKVKCFDTQKETNLWTRDEKTGMHFPEQDDTILGKLGLGKLKDRNKALEKARLIVKPWARAIGRLIFYCMANVIPKDDEYQNTDQRLYVDAHVLPDIYLYYLMAGIEPTSPRGEYPLGDLIRFVSTHRIMSKKDWDWEEDSDLERVRKGLHDYISFVLGEADHPDQASLSPTVEQSTHESGGTETIEHLRGGLRKAAQLDFIDRRQIVLGGLLEGMSLDASLLDIDTQLAWGRAPVKAIRQALCCMPSCSVDNVIKCLKPKYTMDRPEFIGKQKKLLRIAGTGETVGLLPDVLKVMCEDDPDVAGTFMFFATGMRYTPYQDATFRILIEFTFSATQQGQEVTDDMLPWAHTCPRDVLLPGFAYHGNAEVLRKKLSKIIEYAHLFNME